MNPELLRGALEILVLEVISEGRTYGYEIAKEIKQRSSGRLLAQEGTLYPALHRLEKRGALAATWRDSPEGRRRKYYQLTPEGRKTLAAGREEWAQFSQAVQQVLGLAYVG